MCSQHGTSTRLVPGCYYYNPSAALVSYARREAIADGAECWVTSGAPGSVTRSGEQLGKQVVATTCCAAYSFVVTYALLRLMSLVMPVRPPTAAAQARALQLCSGT